MGTKKVVLQIGRSDKVNPAFFAAVRMLQRVYTLLEFIEAFNELQYLLLKGRRV